MAWIELVILVLACNQVVETLRHGSIFSGLRARIEAYDNWLSELVGCGFCLSHWIGGMVVVWWATSKVVCHALPDVDESVALWLWLSPLIALAVTRGAQLLNDATKNISRTPGSSYEDPRIDEQEQDRETYGNRERTDY